ncbi:MAG: nucleoside/nucleotide kinase family protein [Actinomycetota bacterium]|nr:nucleoside/nucleotide kinase family protein [Actinomycetota bacterium]
MAVPMDGFHMTNRRLSGLGLADRKGAPETFEAQRFVSRLEELAAARGPVSWPDFNRALDDPVEDALVVNPDVKLVFVEGNYLVLDRSPWNQVPRCLRQLWYVHADLGQLRVRLLRRQIVGGRLPRDAEGHVNRVDMINAQTIERCRHRAGYVFELLPTDPLLHNVPDPATGETLSLKDAGDAGR